MLDRTIPVGLFGLLPTVGAQADVPGWRVGANVLLQHSKIDADARLRRRGAFQS